MASHDLQEPLRKVASFCQLLQRRYAGKLDERADQYIAFAVDGAERMQQLINDLLSFSRVGRTTVRVHARSRSTTSSRRPPRSWSPPRTDVDGDDRGRAAADRAAATRRCCGRCFVNLIGNGLKFHRDGRAATRRRWPPNEIGDEWEITVSDNGIGIDPEYVDKVFVIFQRLHARDVYAGTGIGLALAKKIVEFHGGRIGIDPPRPEPGTTVRLTLPAPRETRHMIASEARVINVLLVEDDPGDVLMTREAFEEYLHNRLDVVSDGSEALAYLRREGEYADAPRPDLILLDLNLPRRDGREVLAEVKADENLRTIPVIVLTTSQADEDVLRSYQLHANAYVTKPVDFDGFIEAIRQIDHFFVSVVQLPAVDD